MNSKLKIINRILAFFLLAVNLLYFIPINLKNVYSGFGPMGFGLIAFPFLLIINSFAIYAYLTFKEKYNTIETLILNSIGLFTTAYLILSFKIL